MQKRFTTKLIALTVTGLAFGAGPAMALSTPKAATVTTPTVAVPLVSTPNLATPSESATANVSAIDLPTGASVDLNGAVDQSIATPIATPAVSQTADVPSVPVDSISAGGESVDPQSASVDMPATASADESEAKMATTDDQGASMGWTNSSWSIDANAANHDASTDVGVN